MATRILHQQSNEDCHADLALGSSYVKDWNNRSPRHAGYGEKTINPYIADDGTAVYIVFEGDPDKVVQAGETRRGQSWADAWGKAHRLAAWLYLVRRMKAQKSSRTAPTTSRLSRFIRSAAADVEKP